MAKDDQEKFLELIGAASKERDLQMEADAPSKPAERKASDLTVDELQDLFNKPSYSSGWSSEGGGPASGTETTDMGWNPLRYTSGPKKGRPIPTYKPKKLKRTGKAMSDFERANRQAASTAYNNARGRKEMRDLARDWVDQFNAAEQAGRSFTPEEQRRRAYWQRINDAQQ